MASGYSSDVSFVDKLEEKVVPRVVRNGPRGRGVGKGRSWATVQNLHGKQESLKTEISGMTKTDIIDVLYRVV